MLGTNNLHLDYGCQANKSITSQDIQSDKSSRSFPLNLNKTDKMD